jgi:hypothetical protein
MTIHIVEQGDCVASIAARYGMASWKQLWDHPDNAGLKKLGRHPNILAPGDEIVVPDPPRRWESRPTEKRHRFVTPLASAKLRVVVRDYKGQPLADRRFVVEVGDQRLEGKTDADGLLQASIPAVAKSARLRVWCHDPDDPEPSIDRLLSLGDLDPVESVSGVQARLRNLGYRCHVTGQLDDATIAAAQAFRDARGLPVIVEDPEQADDAQDDAESFEDEVLDDAFRGALKEAHEGTGP